MDHICYHPRMLITFLTSKLWYNVINYIKKR